MIYVVVAALVVLKKVVGRTEAGAYFYDMVALKMPVTGTLTQRTAITSEGSGLTSPAGRPTSTWSYSCSASPLAKASK